MTAPKKFDLAEIGTKLPQKIDIFICSASYEERCLSAALNLRADQIGVSLICANEDFLEDISQNLQTLLDHFGNRARKVMFRQDNPVSALDTVQEALVTALTDSPQNIVLDATTFTHEGLLILLRVLATFASPIHAVSVVYAPANEYAVGLAPRDKWLSKGVREIRSVLGYPGLMSPSRKIHLVVLVGFEVERARLLIDLSEPDVLSLGHGYDTTDDTSSHLSINADTLNQIGVHYPIFDQFKFSSIDYSATKNELHHHIEKYPQYSTIIAPMNTKLSTIGAATYALTHPNVQLCYAPAVTYNTRRYSKPNNYILYLPLLLERKSDSPN